MRRTTIITIMLAGALALAACSSSVPQTGAEASDQLACQQFRQTSQDQVDGILTPTELRDQLTELYTDHGRYGTEAVADASQQLAAAYTQDEGETVKTERIRALGAACTDAGH